MTYYLLISWGFLMNENINTLVENSLRWNNDVYVKK